MLRLVALTAFAPDQLNARHRIKLSVPALLLPPLRGKNAEITAKNRLPAATQASVSPQADSLQRDA